MAIMKIEETKALHHLPHGCFLETLNFRHFFLQASCDSRRSTRFSCGRAKCGNILNTSTRFTLMFWRRWEKEVTVNVRGVTIAKTNFWLSSILYSSFGQYGHVWQDFLLSFSTKCKGSFGQRGYMVQFIAQLLRIM